MNLKLICALLLSSCIVLFGVEIRVATFNIGAHFTTSSGGVYYPDYSLGAAGTPDHDSVRDVLSRIDADVVALEEIHGADISAGDVSTLATSLGYPHVFIAPATNTFDTTLRVAFLSRFPFLTQSTITSPAGAKEMNRLIPVVKVDVPGTSRDPVLIAAHLKSGSAASDAFQRTVEMRRLTDRLSTLGLTAADNFVLMGDFNLSDSNRTFNSAPASGLPASFSLGADITFPITYFTDPLGYFSTPAVNRIIPRQLNGSTVTFPSSGSTIDLFMVSPVIGSRPLHTEIYNSALDGSNNDGLAKSGQPLPAATSGTASDHFALFGDIELDPPEPYAFNAPGETISEGFGKFTGTYDPYPWTTTGGTWQGADEGNSIAGGFRSYGPGSDPSLGFLPGTSPGTATAEFVNHSSKVLSALQISFTAEQWRSSSGGTIDTSRVELITNGVPQALPQLTFTAADNLPNGPIVGGISTAKNMIVSGLSVAPGARFQLRFTFTQGAGGGPLPDDAFINEFNYDDNGADSGEFVEIVVGPGYAAPLATVNLMLYRADGTVYATHSLSTFTVGDVTSSGHKIYSKLISGIQNGPNGMALSVNGAITRFISYEGVITVNGLTSTNIGVTQTGSEPEGQSALGLIGSGGTAGSFIWSKFTGIPYSAGQLNQGQTFTVPPQPQGISIDNLAVTFLTDTDGDGMVDAVDPDDDDDGLSDTDEHIFGTDALDASSRFRVDITQSSPETVRIEFPGATGRNYTVEGSTNLTDWSDMETRTGTGSAITVEMAASPTDPQKFYRIRAEIP